MSECSGIREDALRCKNAHLMRDPEQLVGWVDLLYWQKDNEYILTNYRQASFSFTKSIKSLFRLHNESVNIWSHGIGTVLYSAIPFYLYEISGSRYTNATNQDLLMLAIFFASVTICFAFSSTFHILMNHSPEAHHIGSQLDHLGIVLVIWGSTVPSVHFGFYCDERLQRVYWTLATAAALASSFATTQPIFRTPAGRKIRVLLYGLLGLTAFVAPVHGIWKNGWAIQNERMRIDYFTGLGILNFTGAMIYGVRIPERWYPKIFDVFGASHQIMHVLVMIGALSHSIGLIKAFDYWQAQRAIHGNPC